MKKFNKILIANRGEIAVRIMRTAKEMGIKTVAVFSEIDKEALHVKKADEAFCIGQQELSETYLNIEKIMEVAINTHCDAIHPGYGFLAENPKFVEACDKAGITFIGPGTNPIKLMGNKIEARKFVKELGIPMTEGITGSPAQLLKNAHKVPLPMLVKAAAGGGGKGMRIVREPKELKQVLETTSREAKNYFGDESIYIEQYIEEPRHIEFQVIGDNFGNVVHLFERECTIQRRYQKIIEESPSPTLTPEIRKKMGEAAVAIAKKTAYNSAGTIEFLVDKKLNFYFLEMNTRIQVEHPVTEMITGVDLIEEQISVAAGNKLRLKQDQLSQNGHAIECRIYAEDPENNFMPSPGTMTFYYQPAGEDIRVDTGIESAITIYSFFDPMISKMVVWGKNRNEAIRKSVDALNDYIIHGIQTNIEFLSQVLQHKAFKKNQISTKFCDEHSAELLDAIKKSKSGLNASVPLLAASLYALNASKLNNQTNIWENIGYWRNLIRFSFSEKETTRVIDLISIHKTAYQFNIDGKKFDVSLIEVTKNFVSFFMGKKKFDAFISADAKGNYYITILGNHFKLKRNDVLDNTETASSGATGEGGNNLFAPMPGKVLVINVKEGQKVKRGTVLLVVEAMKMENNIVAGTDAIIEKVNVKEGEMVDTDKQLVQLKNIKN
ncbi:MAG: acetyl-CoA carboxylase biotin carboxylase subunit [Bacteroidetes bacterium]|nr:acetyl-CoA carboxylase biotin carboxylase subunit [Bacteroidota bacterium]